MECDEYMTSNGVSDDKYVTSKGVEGDEWITLKAASKLTGRSINSLRILISRKKIDMVKKMRDNGPGYWVIHKEALGAISRSDMVDEISRQSSISSPHQTIISPTSQVISMPIEYYERQQKEHDNIVQGMMMYRFKFEELEKQVRLLPAPVEAVTTRLQEQERTIEALQAELQQARLPWWKRLMGVK